MVDKNQLEFLYKNWVSIAQRLETENNENNIENYFDKLVSRYSEDQRHYHTLQHITESLELLNEYIQYTNPISFCSICVKLAIWYHDVVYDPKSKNNEEASLKVFQEDMREILHPDKLKLTSDLILGTINHLSQDNSTEFQVMLDIDLAILGRNPERFWNYEEQIRNEYIFVEVDIYQKKRGEILKSFYNRQKIYNTEYFRNRFESQARNNLEKLLEKYDQ